MDNKQIKKLIECFTGIEKEILALRYLEDKTQEEVSLILGIHKKFVSKIEKHAIEKIRLKKISL